MKKYILLSIVGIILCSGCSDHEFDGVINSTSNEKKASVVTFEGKPLTCYYEYSGVSCNWEKYNANK